jgi:hypothetical protein
MKKIKITQVLRPGLTGQKENIGQHQRSNQHIIVSEPLVDNPIA